MNKNINNTNFEESLHKLKQEIDNEIDLCWGHTCNNNNEMKNMLLNYTRQMTRLTMLIVNELSLNMSYHHNLQNLKLNVIHHYNQRDSFLGLELHQIILKSSTLT